MRRRHFIPFILILLLCITLYYIGVKIYSHTAGLSISDQGSTGDAFNGFLTPIITVLSAILIYFTFREQNKANKLLSAQNQFDSFFKLFAEMERNVEKLRFTSSLYENEIKIREMNHTGLEALTRFVIEMNSLPVPKMILFLKQFALVLEDFVLLFDMINFSKIENRIYFIRRLENYYAVNIKTDQEKLAHKLPQNIEGLEYFYDVLMRSQACFSVAGMQSEDAIEQEQAESERSRKKSMSQIAYLTKRKRFYYRHPRLKAVWQKYRRIRFKILKYWYED